MPIPCPTCHPRAWHRYLADHPDVLYSQRRKTADAQLARDCCARCSDEREACPASPKAEP